MSNSKEERASAYRSMQVLLLVFSLIFFFVIDYGYFNLFIRQGVFIAVIIGSIMAIFAWYLARVVGSSPGGIKAHPLLFAWLLIISAAGVFNSLMLYFEGGRIVADAASDSQEQFAALQKQAESGLEESGATAKVNRIETLSESLFSEIRNPLNCGQGPVARRIMSQLQRELPGFTPLSNPSRDCSRNEEVIEDYRDRINSQIARATWNNPELQTIVSQSGSARQQLGKIRTDVTTSYEPTNLRNSLNGLEEQDVVYRDLLFRLSKQTDVEELDPGLHISEVQNLGNAFKLPALFFERLDSLATWVYLALAFAFDLMMVHLFQLVRKHRIRKQASHNALTGAL